MRRSSMNVVALVDAEMDGYGQVFVELPGPVGCPRNGCPGALLLVRVGCDRSGCGAAGCCCSVFGGQWRRSQRRGRPAVYTGHWIGIWRRWRARAGAALATVPISAGGGGVTPPAKHKSCYDRERCQTGKRTWVHTPQSSARRRLNQRAVPSRRTRRTSDEEQDLAAARCAL